MESAKRYALVGNILQTIYFPIYCWKSEHIY